MRAGRTDYRMARRALLREVSEGLRSVGDVCDAHPDLMRAGRNVGEVVPDPCPICEATDLRLVTYVFGNAKGGVKQHGRVVPRGDRGGIAVRAGDAAGYVVEVCTSCAWHHLRESFWLGQQAAGAQKT